MKTIELKWKRAVGYNKIIELHRKYPNEELTIAAMMFSAAAKAMADQLHIKLERIVMNNDN